MNRPAREELFQPTLENAERAGLPKPWYPKSLYYLAFFGGGLAAALVSFENARRLRMPSGQRWLLLGLGMLFAVGVAVGVRLWVGGGELPRFGSGDSRSARMVTRFLALGLAWLLIRLQRRADAVYQLQADDEGEVYGSMWGAGFLAAVLGILIQAGLTLAVFTVSP